MLAYISVNPPTSTPDTPTTMRTPKPMSLPAPRVIQVDTRGAKILDEESREVRHVAFFRRNCNLTAVVS